MPYEGLITFIAEFIASRRQTKLDAFEKEAVKRLVSQDEEQALALEREALERRYAPRQWLTEAAARAGQFNLVSHAAKFTHGDSRSSSIYSEIQQGEGYLGSSSLSSLPADTVGNAAALDVAKFLQTEVQGDSLISCLKQKDYQPLKAYAESEEQLAQWVEGFSRALIPGEPTSHKLAKQIYFPVGENYHLLSPLFASSFAHHFHQKLVALRFGDDAKAAKQARREGTWHEKPVVIFPDAAEMHFGGTKPQNISALNSARGGKIWLLSAHPPVWVSQEKPPTKLASLFSSYFPFDRNASSAIRRITHLMGRTREYTNAHIREARDRYVDEIIDLLMVSAAGLQRKEWQGWTRSCPELKPHQQLWLDPWRTLTDELFRQEREKGGWQQSVAEDFARWLNHRLRKHLPDVGQPERREWETWPGFYEQLREMEQIISEGIK